MVDQLPQDAFPSAYSSVNEKLNRYSNVPATESTRVVIEPLVGAEIQSDYVNANYITIKNITYIASQGPLTVTEESFWTMILQKRIPNIFMLGPHYEYHQNAFMEKCSWYFPFFKDNVHSFKSGLQVFCKERQALTNSIERRTLQIKYQETEHFVEHYHYHNWFDGTIPQDPEDFLLISTKATIGSLVHCSAGVGRTGTFLCFLFSLLLQEDPINMVIGMRRCRPYMLNHKEQFDFVENLLNVIRNKKE